MTDFKNVLLTEIRPDPNQPRKFYDEVAMQELTESVKEKGILQPILIRPNGKGYILVCGERRFRAAGLAGLSDVPAVVRQLTDEEALELQIIENLQRKDVHPMEEAVAFKSLIDAKKWSVTEVAHRVGKKEQYVRQRLRLADLTSSWQTMFYKNAFAIVDALKICVLPEKQQTDLYKDLVDKNDEKSDHPKISISSYRIEQYKGDLHKASFDLTDPTLNPKMGPCTTCPYNTACAMLFDDAVLSPRCTNLPCFKLKTDVHFKRELKKAKEDPAVVLVNNASGENGLIQSLKKDGHAVLRQYSDFNEISAPDKPDWEEYLEDNFDEDTDDITEFKANFEKKLADYDKELQAFHKKISASKYKKAFVVDDSGLDTGKYVYIELKKATGNTTPGSQTEQSAETDAASITGEIERIKAREKRSKELDDSKAWDELKTHFRPELNLPHITGEFTAVEREAVAMALENKLDFSKQQGFRKFFKIKGENYTAVDDNTLRQMIRYFFLAELPPAGIYGSFTPDALTCIKVAKEYFPSILDDIMNKHKDIAAKREERVVKRMSDLNAKKKELTSKKPATKEVTAAVPAKTKAKK